AEAANASIPVALASRTIRMAMQLAAGNAAAGVASASAGFLTRGVLKTMFLQNLGIVMGATIVLALTAGGALGWGGQSLQSDAPATLEGPIITRDESEGSASLEVDPESFLDGEPDEELEGDQKSESKESSAVSFEPQGDGKPDGKKSLGGSGEMIELG